MKADDKLKKQKTSDTKEETMIAMRRQHEACNKNKATYANNALLCLMVFKRQW